MSDTKANPDAPPASRWGVLRHRHYRNIWGASFASNVGSWMEMVAVQWVMAQAALAPEWVNAGKPGAAIMMGYLATAQMAPILLLGLVGGMVADRVDRRAMLMTTQALLMLIAGALAAAAWLDSLTPTILIVLGAANGVALAFNMPAWGVLTPRLVPRTELTRAIVLNGLQFNMARVVGPALAGVMLAWLGAGTLFAINAGSFLGVIWAVSRTPPAPAPPRESLSARADLAEAMRFTFRTPGPLAIVLAIFLFSMLATPLLRLMPIVVSEVYRRDADAFGMLLAVMGGGAVVGALTIRFVPAWYPRHHFIPLSVALGGLALAATVASPTLAGATVAIFFCGIFWLWTFNTSFAALQLLVDDRMRGRVMSITNVLSFGATPVGTLIAGLLGEWASGRKGSGPGAQIGMAALAIALALAGLAMLVWRTPEMDGLKPGDPGFDRRPGLIRGLTASSHRPAPSRHL